MTGSGSHDLSISEEDFVKFAVQWDAWIEQEIQIWAEFHQMWLKQKKPMHVIRYEDIMHRKEETITDLIKFIFMAADIDGTRI